MQAFHRWTAITVLLLCGIVVVIAGYLSFVLDPNEYKQIICQRIKATTGIEVTIAGPLAISILPRLRVSAHEITLANALKVNANTRLTMREAHIEIELLPLLMQRLVLTQVRLHEATLLLEHDAAASIDWNQLGALLPTANPLKAWSQPLGVALSPDCRVALAGGEIRWQERQTGRTTLVATLSMNADQRSTGQAEMTLRAPNAPPGQALADEVTFHSDIEWQAAQIRLNPVVMKARLAGHDLAFTVGTIDARGDLLIDLDQGRVSILALRLTGAGTEVTGTAQWRYAAQAGRRTDYALHVRSVLTPPLLQWLHGKVLPMRGLRLMRLEGDLNIKGSEQEWRLTPVNADLSIAGEVGGAPVHLAVRNATANLTGWPPELTELSNAQVTLAGNDIVPLMQSQSWGHVFPWPATLQLAMDTTIAGNKHGWRFSPLHLHFATAVPQWIAQPVSGQMSAKVTIGEGLNHAEMHDMALTVLGVKLNGNATLDDLRNTVRTVGHVQSSPFDLQDILTRLGHPLSRAADPSAMRKVAVGGRFDADRYRFLLQDLDMTVDDSHVTGSAVVNATAQPHVRFTLAVDRVVGDRYWHVWPDAPSSTEYANPLEALDALGIRGELTVERLQTGDVELRNVRVSVSDSAPEAGRARSKPLPVTKPTPRSDTGLPPTRLQQDKVFDPVHAAPRNKQGGRAWRRPTVHECGVRSKRSSRPAKARSTVSARIRTQQ